MYELDLKRSAPSFAALKPPKALSLSSASKLVTPGDRKVCHEARGAERQSPPSWGRFPLTGSRDLPGSFLHVARCAKGRSPDRQTLSLSPLLPFDTDHSAFPYLRHSLFSSLQQLGTGLTAMSSVFDSSIGAFVS